MSPEIKVNGEIIADVPDETGIYLARDLTPLYVDVDQIDARKERQVVKVVGSRVKGVRLVGLTLDGKGSSANTKKGGDGRESLIEVTLHDRPIRVTYTPVVDQDYNIGRYGERVTRYNPRWVRGHGRR